MIRLVDLLPEDVGKGRATGSLRPGGGPLGRPLELLPFKGDMGGMEEGFLNPEERSKNSKLKELYVLHDKLQGHPAYSGWTWSSTYAKQWVNIYTRALRAAEAFYKDEKLAVKMGHDAQRIRNVFKNARIALEDAFSEMYGTQEAFIPAADDALYMLHFILDHMSLYIKR